MLFSSQLEKLWIKRIVKRLAARCQNRSILDVGAGEGAFSDLLKEELPSITFSAVELWKNPPEELNLKRKYDVVYKQDATVFVPDESFGITVFAEQQQKHVTKAQILQMYHKWLNASEFVILSLPIHSALGEAGRETQGDDEHVKREWSHEEVLVSFPHLALSYVENEIGIYVGFNPKFHTEKEVTDADAPIISIYGICKNEESCIKRFLESSKQADEIILCDTGSTDGTNAVIDSFRKAHPEVRLSVYTITVSPWRFDDARNTALSLVNPNADLCISLNIDEYLMAGWKEHLIANWEFGYTRYRHLYKTLVPDGSQSEQWHKRIHSRSGYTWKLPVHEILEYNGEEKIKHLPEFCLYRKLDKNKTRPSYLSLLEQSVKERRDVWKSWALLAEEYLHIGRYEDAEKAVDTALNIENSDKSYLLHIKFRICSAQGEKQRALTLLEQAIYYLPNRREPYFNKGLYLHELGRHAEAWFALKEAERCQERLTDDHDNPQAWGKAFEELKQTIGELAQKEEQWR
ncbi:glycosyltransferase [Shouchella tritolerans]|uniref:glycosyltransferase n=1 Tax=Shouchella tritolerans TaxID=2979466 RepID=UPI0021E8B96C|nr:glycosyltransferase [Shouchella tritolerans]